MPLGAMATGGQLRSMIQLTHGSMVYTKITALWAEVMAIRNGVFLYVVGGIHHWFLVISENRFFSAGSQYVHFLFRALIFFPVKFISFKFHRNQFIMFLAQINSVTVVK